MAKKIRDFDRFLAEREDKTMLVRVFGRDCEVPVELPWLYVLKVEDMMRERSSISGQDNLALLRQMFKKDDMEYIAMHPDFRASYVWDLIAYTWLRAEEHEEKPTEPVFRTEDDIKIAQTRDTSPKKEQSAR